MTKPQNLTHCPACDTAFDWLDAVVFVDGVDAHYHERCVDLIPINYAVFLKDGSEHLGSTDEIYSACEVLPEGSFTEND